MWLITSALSIGCTTTEKDINWTAEEIHREARQQLEAKDWDTAIEYYNTLERRYPYGKYAEQSKLELIYAHYKNGQSGLAISVANDFIFLYPTHPRADYAHFFKAVAMFDTSTTLFREISGVSSIKLDITPATHSFEALNDFVTQYPESSYIPEARERMRDILEIIASHEIAVGKHYYDLGAYVAALARAKYVIENYPETAAVEDGLGLMLLTYEKMELMDLFFDTKRIMEQNYPNSFYLPQDS